MDLRPGDGWGLLFWMVFASSSSAMALVDEERRLLEVNDPGARLLGRSREEILGRTSSQLGILRPPDRAEAARFWHAFARAGEGSHRRIVVRPDGSQVEVDVAGRVTTIAGRRLAVNVMNAPVDTWQSIAPTSAPVHTLTNREREVVTLVALGRKTGEIAAELYISRETVRTHVGNAMSKLGARNRAHAIALAMERGLIDLPKTTPKAQ